MDDDPSDDALDELTAAARQFARAILAAKGDGGQNVSVVEAAARLGVSRSTLYNKLRTGEIKSVTIGSRRLIPTSEVRRLTRR
jgi:excisionase family DNA binding protein